MPRIRTILAALFVVSYIAAPSFATTGGTAAQPSGHALCFPAKLWSAKPGKAPCTAIGRPEEDGSGWLALSTANGQPRAICTIPNPVEEPRRFVVRCKRTD